MSLFRHDGTDDRFEAHRHFRSFADIDLAGSMECDRSNTAMQIATASADYDDCAAQGLLMSKPKQSDTHFTQVVRTERGAQNSLGSSFQMCGLLCCLLSGSFNDFETGHTDVRNLHSRVFLAMSRVTL